MLTMDREKFRKYWEAIGKPELECQWEDNGLWCYVQGPSWQAKRYRIKYDPHWELRQKWLESDRKLPIEYYEPTIDGWIKAVIPIWENSSKYREAKLIPDNIDVSDFKEKPKRDPSNMRPFEWLYWAFVDAGMEKEAEGMEYMLITLRGALEEAKFQRDKRFELEKLLEKRFS